VASVFGATQHRGDPGAQFRVGERFGDDVIAAAVEHSDAVDVVRALAEHDDRCVGIHRERLAGADVVEELERVPVTSTMIRAGCSTDSSAIALARPSAALIR
jgi:hypothetical protein